MTDRIDPNGANREIERALQTRRQETSKKTSNQEFQSKLQTNTHVGQASREQSTSKRILEEMAKAEEGASAETSGQELEGAFLKKSATQEKAQKGKQKETHKASAKDKQVEQKQHKVALDLAVQRKQQQEQDSGEFGGSSSQNFFKQAVNLGMVAQQTEATPQGAPQISEQVLNQIVDQVYQGIDPKGNSMFVIDFKAGVLGGGSVQISAQGKAVILKFSGLDKSSKNLVKASEGELARRLAGKSLQLQKLDVA